MQKIAIIKLGAKGDVIRTLSVLPALKKKYPESEITWITRDNIADLLENQPLIKEVKTLPFQAENKFDILYNFDIEDEATSLASSIEASKKLGFYSESGFPAAFNLGSEYYLNTLFDDEIKKTNIKTYQEMMFEAAELPYNMEHETLYLQEPEKSFAEKFKIENKIQENKLVGIHMGAGPRWPSKAWHKDHVKKFIKLAKQKDYGIILFGGPDEVQEHKELSQELSESEIKIYQNNPNNTNKEFTALLNLCDHIVCSDSFALHIAIALKKPTSCLFFCTSPKEVESYNLLKKIVSSLMPDYFPEKMDQYSEELVKSISPEEVLNNL